MKTLSTYLIESISNIFEGGAGGHMMHPYLLPWVKSGNDLITFFKNVVDNINDLDASMKIDGVNTSIRMIDGQFVFDRMDPKDVNGIYKDQLSDRFGASHGLVKMGGTVLDIFNEGVNACKSELKQLGLLDDPTILFNIEYVDKDTNLIHYDNSFLAIHGLLQYEFVGNTQKRVTHEIRYNKNVLDKFIEKLNTVAKRYGFNIIGSVAIEVTGKPDLQKVLDEPLTINKDGECVEKSLSAWLNDVKEFNPKPTVSSISMGTVGAMSKKVYLACADITTPLNEKFKDKHIENIVNCYIIHRATLELGNEILKNINSKIGSGTDNEGIVIRNHKITKVNEPVKIVGGFMLAVLNSKFA